MYILYKGDKATLMTELWLNLLRLITSTIKIQRIQ